MIVMPTGSGKTPSSAGMFDRVPEGSKCLWLVHRDTLVHQSVKQFKKWTTKTFAVEHKKEGIKRTHAGDADIIVASVHSLENRLKLYGPDFFDYIGIDECHRFAGNTWQETVDYFNAKHRFGVTATPMRHDGFSLMNVYETRAFEMDIATGIDLGWLVPFEWKMSRLKSVDFDTFGRTAKNEFSTKNASAAMRQDPVVRQIVSETARVADGRQGIVFCLDVNQVKAVHRGFLDAGLSSMMITGETTDFMREIRDNDFKSGKVQFAVGCEVFVEGYDHPGIGVVAMARPTLSWSRYVQCAGRGARPIEAPDRFTTPAERKAFIRGGEKPCVTLIDFVGNSKRHDFRLGMDVLSGQYSSDEREEVVRLIGESKGGFDINEITQKAKENVAKRPKSVAVSEFDYADLAAEKAFTWRVKNRPDHPMDVLGLDRKAPQREVDKEHTYGDRAQRARLFLEECKLTEREIQMLDQYEVIYVGRVLFNRDKRGLANYPQCRLLENLGYDVTNMSWKRAGALISAAKKDGLWIRPRADGPNQKFLASRNKGAVADVGASDTKVSE
jgi:superfamily II DNA or RNA helicase